MTAEKDQNQKVVKSETTTTTDHTEPGIQTTTTTTVIEEEEEPERLDFDFDPNKQLNEALEKQRQEERECIQRLIEENVRLDREKKKAQEDASEMRAKFAALQIEVDALRDTNKRKETVVEKKTKEEVPENVGYDHPHESVEAYEIKIRDLKFRLKRLADDDRVKDNELAELQKQREHMQNYMQEMERHLGEEKIKEIQQEMEDRKENTDEEDAKFVDRSQIVRQGHARSAFCSIM